MYDYHEFNEHAREERWLSKLGYRCQFSKRPVARKWRGRYRPYAFHHVSDRSYDMPIKKLRPGWDVLLLSKRSHWFVHLLGGQLLLSSNNVRSQNKWARRLPLSFVWEFPNPLQRCFHNWCRFPDPVRAAIKRLSLILLLVLILITTLYLIALSQALHEETGFTLWEWIRIVKIYLLNQ